MSLDESSRSGRAEGVSHTFSPLPHCPIRRHVLRLLHAVWLTDLERRADRRLLGQPEDPEVPKAHLADPRLMEQDLRGVAMGDYLGVVVRESLQDPSLTPPVIASKHGVQWTLLLVRIPAEELHRELEAVQSNLDRTNCWYAHFFREDELVVVFDDEVFWASTDPATWGSARQHGKDRGLPVDQLDFSPRTVAAAEAEFGLRIG
jgi:hypothetical protein